MALQNKNPRTSCLYRSIFEDHAPKNINIRNNRFSFSFDITAYFQHTPSYTHRDSIKGMLEGMNSVVKSPRFDAFEDKCMENRFFVNFLSSK